MWRIPLFDLDYGKEEEEAVLAVLRSKWLTMGEVTQHFEQAFTEMAGVKHAVAVANGTVALHLACAATGIGPDDEVIVPALTFVATAAAVKYTGAKPVFADVTSPDDLTISPASIESLITPKTRAVMVMHYAGYMCDMPAIAEIAREHELLLLEDAAHAPGAELDNRKAGAWGIVSAFSFFSNKNLATGEGGMVITSDDEVAGRLRRLRSHGMTTVTWDRYRGQAWCYDVTELGYNYRPSEILSALGSVQLSKLEENNRRRRELTSLYHEKLAKAVPQLGLPFRQHRGVTSGHILPVLLPEGLDRGGFMERMKSMGIQTSIHYPPIPNFQHYQDSSERSIIPLTRTIAPREVTLPLYPKMTLGDVESVVGAVKVSLKDIQ